VYLLNSILNPVFTLLFLPFRSTAPEWSLLWISLATAVLALLVYRFFSAQEAIRSVKEKLKAHILEMRLFQHDPALMSRAILSVFKCNARYLRLNVKPFLFMFVPVVLILVQLESRYGYRPFLPGDTFLVKTIWKTEAAAEPSRDPSLDLSGHLSAATPALRIPHAKEIDWRLTVTGQGPASIGIGTAAGRVTLPVAIGPGVVPLSPWNGTKMSLDMLLHPAAHALPGAGDLVAVEIAYPPRDFRFLGISVHWIWPYLVLSRAAGYLLKGLFRVQL